MVSDPSVTAISQCPSVPALDDGLNINPVPGPPTHHKPGPTRHAVDTGIANVRDFLHCSSNRNLIVTLKPGIDCNIII
jgi:hypothetical protein